MLPMETPTGPPHPYPTAWNCLTMTTLVLLIDFAQLGIA